MTNKKQKKNNKPPIKRLNISNTSQDSTKNKIVALFILILLLTSGIGIFLLRRVNFNEKNSLDNIDNKDKLAVEDVKKDKLSNNLLFNTTSKSKIKKFNTPKHEPTNLEFIEKIKKKLKFHEDFRGTEKEKMNITEHYVNIILNLAKNSSSKAHYINFVLSKSSKFTLLIMPNNFSTANYNELTNAMQLPSDFSADPLAREQSSLITLSHEFWHAYMAILHSCEFNFDPQLANIHGKKTRNFPTYYSTYSFFPQEEKEYSRLFRALKEGKREIGNLYQLHEKSIKNILSSKEEEELQYYKNLLRDYKPLYATLISGDIILDPIKEFLIDIDILYGRLNDLSKTYKKEKLFATESELNARILTEHDTMLTELPEYIIDIFYKKRRAYHNEKEQLCFDQDFKRQSPG
jgi:hypothetical protein